MDNFTPDDLLTLYLFNELDEHQKIELNQLLAEDLSLQMKLKALQEGLEQIPTGLVSPRAEAIDYIMEQSGTASSVH
jgi:hypothetical protein